MKEVIKVNIDNNRTEIPIEFTHYLSGEEGWIKDDSSPTEFENIVYLGYC